MIRAAASRKDFLEQFPVYNDLAYGSRRRTDYGADHEEFFRSTGAINVFKDNLSYAVGHILGVCYRDLFVEIFP